MVNPIFVQEEQTFIQKVTTSEQAPPLTEPVPPVSNALVVHTSEKKTSEEKVSEEEAPFKRLKFLIPNPTTSSPTPLNLVLAQDFKQPTMVNMLVEKFTVSLFKTTSSEYSPTPPRDKRKGKGIAIKEDLLKVLIPLIDEGGSAPKMPNLNQFSTSEEEKLNLDDVKAQMEEMRRLTFLKKEKEKTEKKLKKLTPAEI
ncbi:hypothetical protein Tco_1337292 [Tanacetum coccineum]